MKTNLCWVFSFFLFFSLSCAKVRGGVGVARFQTMEKTSWKNKLFLIKANIIFAKGFRISFGHRNKQPSKYSSYTSFGYCLTQCWPGNLLAWLQKRSQAGKVFQHLSHVFGMKKCWKFLRPSTFLHDMLDSCGSSCCCTSTFCSCFLR